MRILGIDPGVTTGWCLYDSTRACVIRAGEFPGFQFPEPTEWLAEVDVAVIERPKGYGPTRPQLVDCGYVAGRIVGELRQLEAVRELTRLEVCKSLTAAMSGEVRCRNDSTVWAALLHLHGGELAVKKGGPLYGVKAHARAALAVAFVWGVGNQAAAMAQELKNEAN